MKDKAVAEHPDLPPEVKTPGKLSSDDATLNINARLCNSNPVQAALKDAVEDVKRILGVKDDGPKVLKKKRLRAKSFAADGEAAGVPKGEKSKSEKLKASRKQPKPPEKPSRRDDVDLSEEPSDYDEYADRLASGSENDDMANDDMTDVDALERQLAEEGIRNNSPSPKKISYNLRDDLSFTSSSSSSRSASPTPRKAVRTSTNNITSITEPDSPPRSLSPSPRKSARTKTTSFIPSLTMGGYISGSGSDIEDIDSAAAPKRNRRGQRARQQIWEQKYGVNAKHIQKQSRDVGWDRKRGAVEQGRGRGWHRVEGRARRASPDYNVGAVEGAAPVVRARARVAREEGGKKEGGEERPMHPSWEAAKKAKERREAPVAFAGVKTTFD